MATLAEELLLDLEDEEGDVMEDLESEQLKNEGAIKMEVKTEPDENGEVDQKGGDYQTIDDVFSVTNLLQTEEFNADMEQLKTNLDQNPKAWTGLVEQNPEYLLVMKANNWCQKIDNEIAIVHKFIQDQYQERFPELNGLIPEPSVYLKVVNILGNDLESGVKKLSDVLTSQTILIVTVTASTTSGKHIAEDRMGPLRQGCEIGMELCSSRDLILKFVESRMEYLAPNICRIVGAGIAAKVTAHAGGLTSLTKMPSCNVMLLGGQKRNLQGFSKVNILPHTGYIFYSQIVQNIAPEFRRKAEKLVSEKLILAARVDCFHESENGETGKKLLDEIYSKFDKWQEPPPVKAAKALPIPMEPARKKRGGRRARKMKERLGMTDIRKYHNRMNFGELGDDINQQDLGQTMGQLGMASGGGSGKVRAAPVDKKTQVRISKALQQKIIRDNRSRSGTLSVYGGRSTVGRDSTSGMASSVAFTPLKGLEIVNPNAAERIETPNKYFSDTSGFTSIKPKVISK